MHHSQRHITGELCRYKQRCDNLKCYKSDFLTCSLHVSVNRWISVSIVNLQSILHADLHHRTVCSVGRSISQTPCAFVSKESYLLVASTKKRNLWRRRLSRVNGWSVGLVFRTFAALRCPIDVTNSRSVKRNPLDIVWIHPPSNLVTGYFFFRDESGRSLKLAFYTVQYRCQARMWLYTLTHKPRCLAQRDTAVRRASN